MLHANRWKWMCVCVWIKVYKMSGQDLKRSLDGQTRGISESIMWTEGERTAAVQPNGFAKVEGQDVSR